MDSVFIRSKLSPFNVCISTVSVSSKGNSVQDLIQASYVQSAHYRELIIANSCVQWAQATLRLTTFFFL